MNRAMNLLLILLLAAGTGLSRSPQHPLVARIEADFLPDHSETGMDDNNDPAHVLYRQGKKAIYDEQWIEARKMFSDLLAKFPKSSYRDDAAYWSAYALKHTDRQEALAAYRKFIRAYPRSSYYDDAVADLNEIEGKRPHVPSAVAVTGPGNVYLKNGSFTVGEGMRKISIGSNGILIGEGPDSLLVGKHALTVHADGQSYSYSFGFAPKARALERALRVMSRRIARPPMPGVAIAPRPPESPDPETELRLDALYAIGDTKEDEKSFQTLRSVALDRKQPLRLRVAALDVLAGFEKYDVIPVFMQVAREDTDEDLQSSAIDVLSTYGNDKDRNVATLIELYKGLPSSRTSVRRAVFYSIAEIGSERSVDFLASVARSSPDYDLRKDAVYYLGSIGGERARSALYDILGTGR